jgi:glycosyltransferase involved in cell wall biosynthesis
VVTISDGFVQTLHAWGVPRERVHLIENWAPLGELPLCERDGAWRRRHELGSGPVLLYCGTLGLKHDTDLLFELARRVASRGATVVVASEGIGAEALARRLATELLASLRVLPFQPYEQLPEMLGAADVLLALLGRELGSYSVPSKVLTYLSAGRPLLAAVPSENPAAQLIERTRSGIVVEPEDVDGFFLGAERLLDDAALRAELGARGRTYAESAFSITEIGDRFERVLAQALPTRGKGAAASDPRQLEAVHTPR